MIIGQDKLLNRINMHTLDDFPKSVLLIGLRGSGRHGIVNYMSDKFQLPVQDITENIDVDEIYQRPEPYFYIVDLSKLDMKKQNILLKTVEEPLNNSFIVLLAESKNAILSTLLSRCIIFQMEHYNHNQLMKFVPNEVFDKETLVEIAKTPGRCLEWGNLPIDEMKKLAETIIEKVPLTTFSNVLNILNKIKFKDSDSGYDVYAFSSLLQYLIIVKLKESSNIIYQKLYSITNKLNNDLLIPNIDKQRLFGHYLSEMKMLSNED